MRAAGCLFAAAKRQIIDWAVVSKISEDPLARSGAGGTLPPIRQRLTMPTLDDHPAGHATSDPGETGSDVPGGSSGGEPEEDHVAIDLSAKRDRFIALWSQMGAQWGIPRTMAQVHALLYIDGSPMTADEVKDRLGVSRGNASMTLRALLDWGLVYRVHVPGERRERFEAEHDIWKILQTVVAARKKREIEPLRAELTTCRETAVTDEACHCSPAEQAEINRHNQRIEAMQELVAMIDVIGDQVIRIDGDTLRHVVRLLESVEAPS